MTAIPPVPEVTASDVFIVRDFVGTQSELWRYWTDAAALAAWFGPTSVHIDPESVVVDPQVGGRWDLDMVDTASGDRYPLRAVLRAIEAPDYLEGFVEAASEGEISGITLRVWFEALGGVTRLTIHQGSFTPEQRDPTIVGWEESFRKLDALLSP